MIKIRRPVQFVSNIQGVIVYPVNRLLPSKANLGRHFFFSFVAERR